MAGENRQFSIIVRRNRGTTASQLCCYLYVATGARVSRVTVSKSLPQRFNGIGRQDTGWTYTSPCLTGDPTGDSVTPVGYRDEVLELYLRIFWIACGPELILTDYNVRPHRYLLVDKSLENEDIRRMDWADRSTVLKAIEYVWEVLESVIATHSTPRRTIQEMKTPLLNKGDQLPQELINYLILCTTSRCKACIALRGGHISY
ncbi:transposable element Tcb2 transposase [Trichonephila clavipes]|nr:transposable element Tcb2 transposase [Trichonephila clavipes]